MEKQLTRKEARDMFVDCREYAINPKGCAPEVGRDVQQVLVWYMRSWYGKHDAGSAHSQERKNEIRRLLRGLGRPIYRRRFLNTIDEALAGYDKSVSLGLVSHGNARSTGDVASYDELDETVPATRAYHYVCRLREAAELYPLTWFKCFVLRL